MDVKNNTFWGLILQPGKRYEQIVEKSFHVSMAALDVASVSANANPNTQVMINVDGQEFILCHLNKNRNPQQTLDLNFQGGDSLALYVDGQTPVPVHLTGFYNEIDDDDMEDMTMSDMSDEEEAPDLVPVTKAASLKKSKGKSIGAMGDVAENGSKRKGSPVKEIVPKKAKVQDAVDDDSDDDDDEDADEDDEDEDDDEDDDEVEAEEEEEGFSDEEDDDEEDDEDEDDEDDDDDDESDGEPEIPLKRTQPVALKKDKLSASVEKSRKENGSVSVSESPKKKKNTDQNSAEAQKTPVQQKKKEPVTPNQQMKKEPVTPKSAKKTIGGGVMIEDLIVGSGAVAKRGRPVSVYYVGRLKQNNKQFDQTVGGPGFKFRLGAKEVIKGWDVGVEGMKVGGKRRITCPPHMAYGSRGSPPVIPPNSALVFEVTLKNVH
ncbi:46 kDa FK506-binding nuclear protein-like [Pollicipes pollicipes]|uniref:46 kDa FK506-binding nuclear protein-like n=1 Tax=Pollicipes pollicipes TaxID=41117 RepID=UPI0018852983|nr:46 kDa FK506-binding nuclear protein-like [Pollicipes pollicipes]